LKIVVISNYRLSPERLGGMDFFFWEFNREIQDRKYNIQWFFPNCDRSIAEYTSFSILPWNANVPEKFILDSLIDQQVDVILVHFLELCTKFYRQLKLQHPKLKIILIDHNPRPLEGYSLKIRLKKLIKGKLYSRYIDKFIAVSNYTRLMLLKDFGKQIRSKVEVVYNGISTDFLKYSDKKITTKKMFMVGCHLRESKGIQDLIEAVAMINEKDRNHLLIDIYGDGDYRVILEKKVKELGLTEQFKFYGNHPRLTQVLPQYQFLLQPTHMECFSLGILEALACDVRVLTTPVGGNTEVIKPLRNGFILPTRNPQKWADFILKLLRNEIQWEDCDFSIEIQKRFSIEKMLNEHIRILEEVI
jgi:glycosyltransferase involved in cell wall biosynthesis